MDASCVRLWGDPMPVESVRGLVEAKRNLERAAADLHGKPMLDAMHTAALLVEGDAKRRAPVDTGQLRVSIASEVRTSGLGGQTVEGVVGSNKTYAPYMELGTKPHFPPPAALKVWARRHGRSAYGVARAIARRGLKPRRYLADAFDSNRPRVIRILGDGVSGIVRKANE